MFIDRTKKNGVVTKNQVRLHNSVMSNAPVVSALVNATECVNGKTMFATICAAAGRAVIGKNVPPKINIGVMNRKAG